MARIELVEFDKPEDKAKFQEARKVREEAKLRTRKNVDEILQRYKQAFSMQALRAVGQAKRLVESASQAKLVRNLYSSIQSRYDKLGGLPGAKPALPKKAGPNKELGPEYKVKKVKFNKYNKYGGRGLVRVTEKKD